MCTLLIAIGVSGAPGLYAIANRDEALDRPAAPPAIHERRGMKVLAPTDLEAGGTWLGLNDAGIFAGITNRFRMESKPGHTSRGMLVFRALQERSAVVASEIIAGLNPRDYNGFHLVIAGQGEGFIVWNDTTTIRREALAPGYHAITERSFGAAPSRRRDRLRRRLAELGEWNAERPAQLRRWMVEHDEDSLEATCVHLEEANYGTRSSTLVEVGDDDWKFCHADGAPCTTPYRKYDAEIEVLRAAQSD